ncbi:MAG: hypothetical protein A2542_03205 [Parcubacteria group bacterium RIFOXYD2_FULL_52_8]|nr:MAG: hypothetical protein A2542_03205 [Parcubacteria group bacterium RIFOXYD2_FULL_52_8]
MQPVLHFFDRVEDRVRKALSHHPVPYSLLTAVAIVVFWDGVSRVTNSIPGLDGFWGGILLIVGSAGVLLATGVFVSFFIGDTIIISGIRGEKKAIDKTEDELRQELNVMDTLEQKLDRIEEKVDHLEKDFHS